MFLNQLKLGPLKNDFFIPLVVGLVLLISLELGVHVMKWTFSIYWPLGFGYFVVGYSVSKKTPRRAYQDKLPYSMLILLILSWTAHISLRNYYPLDLFGIVCLNVLSGFLLLLGASLVPFRLYLKELKGMMNRNR